MMNWWQTHHHHHHRLHFHHQRKCHTWTSPAAWHPLDVSDHGSKNQPKGTCTTTRKQTSGCVLGFRKKFLPLHVHCTCSGRNWNIVQCRHCFFRLHLFWYQSCHLFRICLLLEMETTKRLFNAPHQWRFCWNKELAVFLFIDTFRSQWPFTCPFVPLFSFSM